MISAKTERVFEGIMSVGVWCVCIALACACIVTGA